MDVVGYRNIQRQRSCPVIIIQYTNMRKKIGGVIVSDLNHTNYGSCLQAYATLKTVERLGYELTFIKYRKQRSLWDWLKITPGLLLSGGLELIKNKIKYKSNLKRHPNYADSQKIRCNITNAFKQKEFVPHFKEYIGYKALCEGSKNFDACFVGSDQVWRPYGFYSNYWNLNFVDDCVPKFSYASSYGVSRIPAIQKAGTKRYLERLDMISVREIKAKDIVNSISNKKAIVVVDPTMLFTHEQWIKFANESNKNIPIEPYIFCYFLGNQSKIREEVKKLAQKTGLKIVIMRHMDEYVPADETLGDYAPYDIDARDFVKLLANAKYVCTDSFHGTVFSILMHRKFCTFYRTKPSASNSTHSRVDNLLNIFNLINRKFNGDIMVIQEEITYANIEDKLREYRAKSLDFLKRALALADNKQENRI